MVKLKLFLYCTEDMYILSKVEYLYGDEFKTKYECIPNTKDGNKYLEQMGLDEILNGKVIAECDFEVEKIFEELYGDLDWQHDYLPTTNTMSIVDLERESCLDREELRDYCNGYAIHLKNIHIFDIFDKPRELSDFNKIIETTYGEEPDAPITRAPQNMMRCCYEKKPKEWETGVLISVKPEYLCKILNREKRIEVRKEVLKEMLNSVQKTD